MPWHKLISFWCFVNYRDISTHSIPTSSMDYVEEQVELEDIVNEEIIKVTTIHKSVGVQANLVDKRKERYEETSGLADVLSGMSRLSLSNDKCTQDNFLPLWSGTVESEKFSVSELLNSDDKLFAFTGIHSIDLLNVLTTIVSRLTPDRVENKKEANKKETNKKILCVRDRVILTMIKIKMNLSFKVISVLFGVSRGTCSNYFKNMCSILAKILRVAIPWPEHEEIRSNMPISFKKFKRTRIILDCAETPIEKCKCLKCRILTYSQYKKTHTVKFNIGVTPSGLITEASVPFGGRASDKKIVNESEILNKLDYNDGVMVDKGYKINKECEDVSISNWFQQLCITVY